MSPVRYPVAGLPPASRVRVGAGYRSDTPAGYAELARRQWRLASAQNLADLFCKATLEKFGTYEEMLNPIFVQVHRLGLQREFHEAVLGEAQRHGVRLRDAHEIIEREFGGNVFERVFKSAPRKEHLDFLDYGRNTYRATAWDYRLNGMYRSMADFFLVCKRHPVMSAGVIGSVAWLGHIYPFLGAVSGVAILGWAGVFTLKHELQAALQNTAMDACKAEHYRNSGENMAAFLITAIGGKGIYEGTVNGWKTGTRVFTNASRTTWPQTIQAGLRSTGSAIASTLPPEQKMNPLEAFLFVSGLFDNVLLPFNWLADQIKHREGTH